MAAREGLPRGTDGERDNITIMQDNLRAMGQPDEAFDWVRDCLGHDSRYAIESSKLHRELGWCPRRMGFSEGLTATITWYRDNEGWWRLAKEASEAKYAERGNRSVALLLDFDEWSVVKKRFAFGAC